MDGMTEIHWVNPRHPYIFMFGNNICPMLVGCTLFVAASLGLVASENCQLPWHSVLELLWS